MHRHMSLAKSWQLLNYMQSVVSMVIPSFHLRQSLWQARLRLLQYLESTTRRCHYWRLATRNARLSAQDLFLNPKQLMIPLVCLLSMMSSSTDIRSFRARNSRKVRIGSRLTTWAHMGENVSFASHLISTFVDPNSATGVENPDNYPNLPPTPRISSQHSDVNESLIRFQPEPALFGSFQTQAHQFSNPYHPPLTDNIPIVDPAIGNHPTPFYTLNPPAAVLPVSKQSTVVPTASNPPNLGNPSLNTSTANALTTTQQTRRPYAVKVSTDSLKAMSSLRALPVSSYPTSSSPTTLPQTHPLWSPSRLK